MKIQVFLQMDQGSFVEDLGFFYEHVYASEVGESQYTIIDDNRDFQNMKYRYRVN